MVSVRKRLSYDLAVSDFILQGIKRIQIDAVDGNGDCVFSDPDRIVLLVINHVGAICFRPVQNAAVCEFLIMDMFALAEQVLFHGFPYGRSNPLAGLASKVVSVPALLQMAAYSQKVIALAPLSAILLVVK